MVLQLSDFPEGWSLQQRSEKFSSDVDDQARSLGWIEGYIITYKRGDTLLDITLIYQSMSRYPIENVTKLLDLPILRPGENLTVDNLTDPRIGDKSRAWRTKDGYVVSFHIEFVKRDIYEQLTIGGTSGIDYEFLKELAQKVESRIA